MITPALLPQDQLATVRAAFPILALSVHDAPLVYLDNAATTQKPQCVLDRITRYYQTENANVHRGVHWLSQEATTAYEDARDRVARFVNAATREEIIWTRGTTEAINLVAWSWGLENLKAGDEILITTMEHHANIVPWQLVCQRTGALLKVAPIDDSGTLDLPAWHALLGPRTRLAAMTQVSNALGTINPVAEMITAARTAGAVTLVDGAQAIAHHPVDVQALGCDFYAFSGHKLYGPTGIGVLWGRRELLEAMPPWQGGGDMIRTVSFEQTTFNDLPYKFEAGTPNIAGAIGLAAALDWVDTLGVTTLAAHEAALLEQANRQLAALPGVRFIGTAENKAAIVSFLIDGIHPHDLGTVLDHQGIAIRAGHHCAMPVMTRFGIPGTARAAFAVYNSPQEIDALVQAVAKAIELFGD